MAHKQNFLPGAEVKFRFWKNDPAAGGCRYTDAIFVVERLLASGGQADTYIVKRKGGGGMRFVMKHLYGDYASDKGKYYKKCAFMSRHPSPHSDLVWPLAVTPQVTKSGSFCFLMELLEGYEEASRVISFLKRYNSETTHRCAEPNDPYYVPPKKPDPNDPASLSVIQRAELVYKTAAILSAIHFDAKGVPNFVYGDISGKNVMYKVLPGGHLSVKVIDSDNLIPCGDSPNYPNGYTLGLIGTGQYPAPEIITGDSVPTIHSDLHALAVFAFRVFHGSHPLDGCLTHSKPFTDENIVRFFGTEATFTLTDPKNGPSKPVRDHWEQLPSLMQKYFCLAFAPDVLHSKAPAGRDKEPRPTAALLMKCLKASYPGIA